MLRIAGSPQRRSPFRRNVALCLGRWSHMLTSMADLLPPEPPRRGSLLMEKLKPLFDLGSFRSF
jgi:hypothetical protein